MIFASPPLAFFGHPLMLGWLAVAAAPIIIHLLSRRRYREVQWAAMQYLLAALKKNARRVRVEQWLLLAVRTLLVIVVVLALAEPYWDRPGLALPGGARTHKMFIVDGSFSMGYRPADKSRFGRAQLLAERIVQESSQGDGFTLLLMSQPPRAIVGRPTFDAERFLEEIRGLEQPDGTADVGQTLILVEQLLIASRNDEPRLSRAEVFFLTDLGRHDWSPPAEAGASWREAAGRISQLARIAVIDLGQPASENIAVIDVRVAEPFALDGRPVTVEAEIHNFGKQPRPGQLVELYTDDRRVGQQHVDLESNDSAAVAFPLRLDRPGDHHIEVRITTDLLDVDNHRYRIVPVRERLRVLCINGKPAGSRLAGATDFLREALEPSSVPADLAKIQADVAVESALVERDLAHYDCVFLANVGQFTDMEAGILEAYVKHGGALVFFLGDQTQPQSYNLRLTGRSSEGRDLLPATLGATAEAGHYRFDPLGYHHPLLAPFRDQEQGGLLTTPIERYVKLQLPENGKGQVALAFDSGEPAIVEQSVGRGRVILVATSADVSWTAMPVWPSFVPLVQEMLALAVRGHGEQRNVLVGQPLGESLRTLAAHTPVEIVGPMKQTATARLELAGDYSDWTFADTWQSGVYAASLAAPVARTDLFAVNVDPAESDLSQLAPAELREQVFGGVPIVLRADWQDADEVQDASIAPRQTIHQGLLWTALGLLIGESVLACWFGRRAA